MGGWSARRRPLRRHDCQPPRVGIPDWARWAGPGARYHTSWNQGGPV